MMRASWVANTLKHSAAARWTEARSGRRAPPSWRTGRSLAVDLEFLETGARAHSKGDGAVVNQMVLWSPGRGRQVSEQRVLEL